MEREFAQKFSEEWIAAWNSHDLDKILSHYTNDFEMTSPIITRLANEPSGTLKGKEAVGAYWAKALDMHPELHFELLKTFAGVNSVVVYYRGHRGFSTEILYFDSNGKVSKACAHYE